MVFTTPTYLFLTFLFVVAFAIGTIIAEKRNRRDKNTKVDDLNISPIIERMLKSLNCTYDYKKDEKWHEYTFRYQSGNFILLCQEGDCYARIHYPNFLTISIDNIELIRQICNECNAHHFNHHVIYTVNGKENSASLHIVSTMSIFEENEIYKVQLTNVLSHFFKIAQEFYARYDKVRNIENGKSFPDVEKILAENEREFHLLREAEIRHQDLSVPAHTTQDEPLTIGALLDRIYNWNCPELIELKIVTHKIKYILTEEEIAQFDISSVLVGVDSHEQPNFIGRNAVLILTFSTNKQLPQRIPTQMTIHLQTEGRTLDVLYMKATLCVAPGRLPYDHAVPLSSDTTRPVSFIFAYDTAAAKEKIESAVDVISEALVKDYEDLQDQLTDEERLALYYSQPVTQENINRGQRLFREKRFYEAIVELEKVFDYLSPYAHKLQKKQLNDLYEICYELGYCYNSLGLYKLGLYYLDSIIPCNNYKYMEEYVNTLVNAKDYRDLSIILELIERTNQQILESEEPSVALSYFINFLHRRQAYALVNHGMINEAKTLLQDMLSQTENQDFALNELAYIQRVYGKTEENNADSEQNTETEGQDRNKENNK